MNLDGSRPKFANIMVVDDAPANLQLLSSMLEEQGYTLRPVPSGKLALQAAKLQPPDLILLDIHMPEMNGYEVCERLKADEDLKGIPVIFVSALYDPADKATAFRVGGVDYITKPYQFEEVKARIETHLRLHHLQLKLESQNQDLQERVQAQINELAASQMATIFALARLAEYRDDDTGRHLERVQTFSRLLATRLGYIPKYTQKIDAAYIDNIYYASPLHDIGKIAIPDSILLKPDRLSYEEFEMMKMHTVLGAQNLEAVRQKYPQNAFINIGIEIARSHHERWDGMGYPDGLAEEKIPLSARIVMVADTYDALRSKRSYKVAYSHQKSVDAILSASCSQFDPDVVDAFDALEEEFGEVHERTEG
jgi:putative two-component system response regulator